VTSVSAESSRSANVGLPTLMAPASVCHEAVGSVTNAERVWLRSFITVVLIPALLRTMFARSLSIHWLMYSFGICKPVVVVTSCLRSRRYSIAFFS